MDFLLSERELTLQAIFRKFASEEVAPLARQIESDRGVTKESIKKLGRTNFFAMALPKVYGGQGESVLSSVIAVEELAQASAGLALVFIENIIAAQIIAYHCPEPLKSKYLGPLLRGEILGGWGFSEPKGGSHPNAIETTAVANGRHYIINGVKEFITGAPMVDVMIVYAKTKSNKLGAFIVERTMDGFQFAKEEEMMGLHGAACGQLLLKEVYVPKANCIGLEGDGVKILNFVAPKAKNFTAAVCLGLTEAVFNCSREYARQRTYQGAPISQFQMVQKRIARIAAQLQAGRWMVYWGAFLQESGRLTNVEASLIKSYLSQIALECAEDAFRIHGARGYTKDGDIERLYRDAIGLQVTMMGNDANDAVVGAALLDHVELSR